MKIHFNSLEEFIDNYESDIVHFCVSNEGGSELAKNLAKSCKRHNIPLVFFGQDKRSLNKLSKYAITVNNIKENAFRLNICKDYDSNFALFGTEEFKKLAWIRYEICKAILDSDRIAIYLDIDIVVKKNYERNIIKYFSKEKNLDAVFQSNHLNEICSGFFAFNKTSKEKIKKIFSEDFLSKNRYQSFSAPADQGFINKVLLKKNNELLNIQKLPLDYYPNGYWWYKYHKLISKNTFLVHYNGVIGDFRKILKMVRHLDYFSFDAHNIIFYYIKDLISSAFLKLKNILKKI